jgi:transposase InsO family protein
MAIAAFTCFCGGRADRPLATRPNEIWAIDFVSDALFNGKRFRSLTVVDAYTRECLAIHVDQGIKGEQVVDVMDRLLFQRGMPPDKIRVDNFILSLPKGAQSLSRRRWITGRISTGSRWTSVVRASRPTMLLWNRSTVGSATNASTRIGS